MRRRKRFTLAAGGGRRLLSALLQSKIRNRNPKSLPTHLVARPGGFGSFDGPPPSGGRGSHSVRSGRAGGRGLADRAGGEAGRPARTGLSPGPHATRPAGGGGRSPRKTPDRHQVGASVRGGPTPDARR